MLTLTVSINPILARIGPFELGWHGIFTALAILVAVWVGLRNMEGTAHRLGLPAAPLDEIALWAVLGGIVGARLFFVLDHLPEFVANPLGALAIWNGGIAVYGSFLGGLVGGIIAARRARLPVWPLLDDAAPAMLIGQIIGRLGCLSNGDAWGAPCTGGPALCLVYTHPLDLLPPSLLGVPTQAYPLYEIVAVLLLLGVMWLARDWLRATISGTTFLVAAIGYAVIRFGLTAFRQETILFWSLQEAQVVALVTGLLAVALLAWRWSQTATVTGCVEPLAAEPVGERVSSGV